MSAEEKKGITVKIDADLHAQVREYLDAHGMNMAEFVSQALDNELHPKNDMKEGSKMAHSGAGGTLPANQRIPAEKQHDTAAILDRLD